MVKATWEPSGEKTGVDAAPAPWVRFLAVPPDLDTIQRSPAKANTMSRGLMVGFRRRRGESTTVGWAGAAIAGQVPGMAVSMARRHVRARRFKDAIPAEGQEVT